jgi:predicted Zn-dependent protease
MIGTILAIGLVVFFLSIPLLSGVLARFVPTAVQDRAGRMVVEQVGAGGKFCTDAEGLAALGGLVDRLAAQHQLAAGRRGASFRVYVVDETVTNAFAAPGGHVVIFSSIIERAETPEEVAGVLAHEMAHVIEGHPDEGLVRALGYGIFGLLAPGGGDIGPEVAKAVITGAYSRGDELDADRVGVGLLNDAGLDSRGLSRFFQRMQEAGDDVPGALEFVSTHPTGEHRTEQVRALERAGEPALAPAAWQALRGVCGTKGAEASVGR